MSPQLRFDIAVNDMRMQKGNCNEAVMMMLLSTAVQCKTYPKLHRRLRLEHESCFDSLFRLICPSTLPHMTMGEWCDALRAITIEESSNFRDKDASICSRPLQNTTQVILKKWLEHESCFDDKYCLLDYVFDHQQAQRT